ncbi:MAG: molybdopterin dinucleotide binding domain-containing protein [Methanobacteriota archaeon]
MIPEGLDGYRLLLGLNLKVILDTGSSTGQGKVMRGGMKITEGEEYKKAAAVCYMNVRDMSFLGVSKGDNVELSSNEGSVVLTAEASSSPAGMVFVPKGPWINSIISAGTSQSGSPNFKGMTVSVSASKGKVKSVDELIGMYRKADGKNGK